MIKLTNKTRARIILESMWLDGDIVLEGGKSRVVSEEELWRIKNDVEKYKELGWLEVDNDLYKDRSHY